MVGSIRSIKYLYKYVYKGGDRAMINVAGDAEQPIEERDEIQEFQDMRHVGSIEAAWRLYGFSTHGRWPAVTALIVHMEGEHNLYFEDEAQAEAQVEDGKATQLMAWFELNKTLEVEERIMYPDVPTKYRFLNHQWVLRQYDTGHLGRVHNLSPKCGACPALSAALRLAKRHPLCGRRSLHRSNPKRMSWVVVQAMCTTCVCC